MLPRPQGPVAQNQTMGQANVLPVNHASDKLRVKPRTLPHIIRNMASCPPACYEPCQAARPACPPRPADPGIGKATPRMEGSETWRRDELTGASRMRLDKSVTNHKMPTTVFRELLPPRPSDYD